MTFALADYRTRVLQLVKSDPNIAQADQDAAIRAALVTYGRLRPRLKQATQALTTGTYKYNLPADWVVGYSTFVRIEYPTGYQIPAYLPLDTVLVEEEAATPAWRFQVDKPTTGQSAILTYTLPHIVTNLDAAASTSVPDFHAEAVNLLAAAICCRQLAAFYGQGANPLIGADVTDTVQKGNLYRALATDYEKRARTEVGADRETPPPAAGSSGSWVYKDDSDGRRAIDDWYYRRL